MMYELLKEAEWLGFSHRGAEKLQNVLHKQEDTSEDVGNNSFDTFELHDSKVAEALLNADKRGRLIASLHLCAKLERIFGKLSEKDYDDHFGGKALSNTWTLGFVIKTMRDFDKTKKEVKRGTRKKSVEQVTKDSFQRRKEGIWNVKESLQELKDVASPELLSSINQVLSEITSHEHMASEKCLAYREKLCNDDAFLKTDKKVFQKLQEVMEQSASNCLDTGTSGTKLRKRKRKEMEVANHRRIFSFTQESHLLDMPEFRSIHFDLWDMTYNESPSMSLSDISIGGAIYEKLKHMLRQYFGGRRYHDLVDVHFHVDTARFVPDQARWFKDKGFCAEKASVKSEDKLDAATPDKDVVSEDLQSHVDGLVDYDTPKSRVWSSYFDNESDRGFLVALHAVLAAKASVDLLKSASAKNSTVGQGCEDQYQQGVRVFVHGVAIILTDEAREGKLQDLMFARMGQCVLVYKKDTEKLKSQQLRIGQQVLLDAQSYDPNCCWSFSDKGVTRFAGGDSQHGETKLRVLHSIENVTEPYFHWLGIPQRSRNILVVSSSFESPFINSVSQRLRDVNVFHRIGQTVLVDMNKYYAALLHFKLTPEEVAMVYAMAGSCCTPATQGVPVEYWFEALINYRTQIGHLRPRIEHRGIEWDLRMYLETTWRSFEKLVAISYGLKRKLSLKRFQDEEDSQAAIKALRRSVSKIPGIGPADLMPESNDIELQTRRAFWVLRYWRLAADVRSDGAATRGLCIEWGYQADGRPLLERPEDLELRKKLLKHIFAKCSCKSGCQDRRCGCRKHDPPLHCILCKCENCKNDGVGDKTRELNEKDQRFAHAVAYAREANEHQKQIEEAEVEGEEGDSSCDESSGYVQRTLWSTFNKSRTFF